MNDGGHAPGLDEARGQVAGSGKPEDASPRSVSYAGGSPTNAPLRPHLMLFRILAVVAGAEAVRALLAPFLSLPPGFFAVAVDVLIISAISAPFLYWWGVRDVAQRLTTHDSLARTALQQSLVVKAYGEQLALAEYAETVVANVPTGLVTLSADLQMLSVNRAFREMFGWEERDAVGQPLEKVLPGASPWKLVAEVLGSDQPSPTFSVDVPDRTGSRQFQLTLTRLRQAGEARLLLVIEDITKRTRMEQRLNTLAHYDTLTGLPNRVLFQDRLAQVLAQARRDQRLVGLLYLDLDRFKVVNDTLGHTVGDQLLKAVAQRLVGAVRASNAVSRLGGDEFTVILPGLTTPEGASVVARKILRLFSEPISVRGHEVFVTSSIGITIYPTDGDEIEALLRSADTAMYRAKERGNTYQFYASDMHSRTVDRLALENSLRRAVEQREFVVFYQPLVGLETGRVVGLEALVRWRRPDGEVVAPGDFIPLAEETGLIIPIGAWVLREACAQARAWQQAGLPPVRVSVNLSSAQVMHVDLPEMVTRALSDSGLDPRSLDLELTESIFMRDAETTTAALNRLHAIGVSFSIDDFGTGYSSLGYLRRFPIGVLKIGRGFMGDVPASADDAAIVTTIIAMAHSLGMRVVAEGVERDDQLAFLRAQGCDVIQGALVSPAVPVEAVTPFLRPQWRLTVARHLDKTA